MTNNNNNNNNNNNKNTMENIGMKKRMKKKRKGKKKGIIIHSCETAHLPLPKATFCPKWDVSINVGLGDG